MKVGTIDPAKVVVYCHVGDNICEGGIIVRDVHHTVRFSLSSFFIGCIWIGGWMSVAGSVWLYPEMRLMSEYSMASWIHLLLQPS